MFSPWGYVYASLYFYSLVFQDLVQAQRIFMHNLHSCHAWKLNFNLHDIVDEICVFWRCSFNKYMMGTHECINLFGLLWFIQQPLRRRMWNLFRLHSSLYWVLSFLLFVTFELKILIFLPETVILILLENNLLL